MKLTRLILCLLLAGLMLAGCTTPGAADDATTPPDADTTPSDVSDTSAAAGGTVLFDENVSYTVVRAEDVPSSMRDMTVELKNRLSELLGATVRIGTDWQKRGTEPDPEAREILFGYTNRPETAEVLATLGSEDYAIRKVGNKIVIAACNIENLKLAGEYFTSELLEAEKKGDRTVITMKSDYTHTAGKTELFGASNPLSGYRVVYAAGDSYAENAAGTLVKAVKKLCDVTLDAVTDATAAQDCEILVGESRRTETKPLGSMSGLEFTIRVEGKKLVIGGGTASATALAVDSFVGSFASGLCTPDVRIAADYHRDEKGTVTLSDGEDPALAEGADLRIMSFNILAELWNDKPPIAGRDTKLATILYCYQPDVVGLQEVTPAWYSALDKLVGGTYEFAIRNIPAGGADYSTLMYNTEKVELLESGCTVYSLGNDPKLRNLTWGHFRRKADGATFIVTSTHWDLSSNAHMQKVQAVENGQLINELYAKYNCPIFSTGDYNETEQSDDFKGFLAATGMQDPKYTAAVINRAGKSTHKRGSTPGTDTKLCIDHIATTGGVDVRYYNTLIAQTALDVSDHSPIYIDVKLK